jgi:glutaconate CoA-transferase subunit A
MGRKLITIEDVVSQIKDGDRVAIGGFGMIRKPMAFIRAIAKSALKDLTIICVGGGVDIDILIALNKVKAIWYAYVSFEEAGLAPFFRKVRQEGKIEAYEGTEYTIIAGLKAAATRVPFIPARSCLGSDILKVNPHYKTFNSPFNGEKLVAIPPLEADVALIHLNYADPQGFGQIMGNIFGDDLIPLAAKRTFISAERIIPYEDIKKRHYRTKILKIFVTGVVEVPFGAHPTSCYPNYTIDLLHMNEYTLASKDERKFKSYLDKYVYIKDHNEYLKKVGDLRNITVKSA